MIGNTWIPLEENPNVSYMKQVVENLQEVKRVSKPWARVYSANQEKQLKEVEVSLKEIYEQNSTCVFSDMRLKEVKEKELKREE